MGDSVDEEAESRMALEVEAGRLRREVEALRMSAQREAEGFKRERELLKESLAEGEARERRAKESAEAGRSELAGVRAELERVRADAVRKEGALRRRESELKEAREEAKEALERVEFEVGRRRAEAALAASNVSGDEPWGLRGGQRPGGGQVELQALADARAAEVERVRNELELADATHEQRAADIQKACREKIASMRARHEAALAEVEKRGLDALAVQLEASQHLQEALDAERARAEDAASGALALDAELRRVRGEAERQATELVRAQREASEARRAKEGAEGALVDAVAKARAEAKGADGLDEETTGLLAMMEEQVVKLSTILRDREAELKASQQMVQRQIAERSGLESQILALRQELSQVRAAQPEQQKQQQAMRIPVNTVGGQQLQAGGGAPLRTAVKGPSTPGSVGMAQRNGARRGRSLRG